MTPKFGRDIAGIGDAIGDQRAIRLADADQAELAAEIGVGPVELLVAVGFGDVLAVQSDQHADGDAVVELVWPVKLTRISWRIDTAWRSKLPRPAVETPPPVGIWVVGPLPKLPPMELL